MHTMLYTEINIFGILILLLLYLGQRRPRNVPPDQRLFDAMLLSTIWIIVLDSGMWVFDGQTFSSARALNYTVTSLYFLFTPLSAFFWVLYTDYKVYDDTVRLKKRLPLYCLPLLITLLFVALNPINGWVFTVNAANIYQRGILFLPLTPLTYVYLAYAAFLALRRAYKAITHAEQRDYLFIAVFAIPPFLGAVIQSLYYGVSLVWVCTILSELLIYINVQNRELSTDWQTGLFNRRQLERYLENRTQAVRDSQTLYLVLLDIDGFKQINDVYGHAVGDEALTQFATLLQSVCIDRSDFLARLGGDEFTIVCERKNAASVSETLARLRGATDAWNADAMAEYSLNFSAGVAAFGTLETPTVDALLRKADILMYEEKLRKQRNEPNSQ